MIDARHEKFAQMMNDVEALEDQLDAAEKEGAIGESLVELKEKLAEARNHLAQLSDGFVGQSRRPSGRRHHGHQHVEHWQNRRGLFST